MLAAVNHVGFNWDACYRARGETRPIGVMSVVTTLAFLFIAVPWMLLEGLDGFVGGIAAITIVGQVGRAYYLRRLFRGFALAPHFLRAIAPTVPAAATILLFRAVEGAPDTLWLALAQVFAYIAITVAATASSNAR